MVLGPEERLLLFRYVAPGFDPFWIMPGGECEAGEDYAEAARRELREETGIDAQPEPLGVTRQADYVYAGEPVHAIEHFFTHRATADAIDTSGHTALEREVMREHRWLTRAEIARWPETIYPLDILDLAELARDRHGGVSA